MLLQLQHQFADGHTEFMSQRETPENDDELRKWVEETKQNHPLPNGAVLWLMCNEKSKFFIFGT